MVLSELVNRLSLASKMGMQYGTDRDLYQALGYPLTIGYNEYLAKYRRHDMAKAIIRRPVKASWQGDLRIVESGEDKETDIEKTWEKLEKELKLKNCLMRVDRLTGIGEYGVLLLGLDDVKNRQQLQDPVRSGKRKLVYVKPFGQGSAAISTYEKDVSNPRYGMPLLYDITFTESDTATTSQVKVHYSRVVHIVDDQLESEVFGLPRLEEVYNRLQDLEKLIGGSAEMFWRGARPGYLPLIDKDFVMTQEQRDTLQDQFDEYEHNLRRILTGEGLSDIKSLALQVADPKGHVDVQIQMISAVTGIPKRILTGSERGELSSAQDKGEWLSYVQTRREEFVEPCIVRPFVDVCIKYGILPVPKEDYTVQWTDLFAPSEQERVEVGKGRAEALSKYASSPMAESVLSPEAFLEHCMGFDKEQIEKIGEQMEAHQAEEPEVTPEEIALLEAEKLKQKPPLTQGGPGSGNFGHAGRPGEVGGSGDGNESVEVEESKEELAERIWENMDLVEFNPSKEEKIKESLKDIYSTATALDEDSIDVTVMEKYDERSHVNGTYSPLKRIITMGSTKETSIMSPQLNLKTKGIPEFKVGGDFQSTFRHEYGHAVYSQFLRVSQQKSWEDFYKENKGLFSQVSGYALTNYSEGFAEVFSAVTSPLYGTKLTPTIERQLPAEIETMMHKLIKK